ncbi:hypothetical protein D9758_000998 [Tetrapyrgos nigripes]|uniref:Cytochrome P450 n=1 Tax=Tetrapyrgos nigripes TaxID=182062 RepID=A0A8H5GYZ7_9AGAR|nr:hypothetical protein D9758_000998 [Tetrapyrgos nigripes]
MGPGSLRVNPTLQTMLNTPYLLAIPVLLIIYYFCGYLLRRSRQKLSYPPGPRGLPIIGSFFDVLTPRTGLDAQWAIYRDMGNMYHSDLLHINILRNYTVVVNSAKAAEELLERRSGIYSSRPPMHMAHESGLGYDFGIFTARLSTSTSVQMPLQIIIHIFVKQPPASSETRRFNNSIHNYGITEQEDMVAFVEFVNNATESFPTIAHGTFLVDYFPLLRYVPAWFPGAHFRRKATRWTQFNSELLNKPWKQLKASISSGTAISCFGTKSLQKFDLTFNTADATGDTSDLGMSKTDSDTKMEEVIRNCAGVAYTGECHAFSKFSFNIVLNIICTAGSDTSLSSPAILKSKPKPKRNWIECANSSITQVFRIVASLMMSMKGISYRKIRTTVVGNAWTILHDKNIYPDPLTFSPDRFLRTEPQRGAPSAKHSLNPDPELYAFGFGRRICPGRHLALDSSWPALACILATYNITRISSDKSEIDPIADFADGLTTHPKPFKCSITPRSAGAFELMKCGYDVGVEA